MPSTSKENPTVALDVETLENSRISTMAKNMQTLMDDTKRKLGRSGSESEESAQEYMISRVPNSIRKEGEHEYYEPQIISIGPIHRDKEALKPMEVLKLKYLHDLIRRNPEKNKLENYVRKVCSLEEKARKFYSESIELGDHFVEMMVLDGCFLIEFLLQYFPLQSFPQENRQRYLDDVSLSRNLPLFQSLNQNPSLLRRDLLLLENQIPFQILQDLYKSSDIPREHFLFPPPTLEDLISCYVIPDSLRFRLLYWLSIREISIEADVVHLLHVYHAFSKPPTNYHGSRYPLGKKMRRIGRSVAAPFLLLLSCLLTCKIPTNFWEYRRRADLYHIRQTEIPSASQLYNSGVKFKNKTSRANCLSINATFDKEEGNLEIPMFSLQEAEISTFRNLLAFEQMYPRAGNHITSHALLMACLIRKAEDVAILRDSGIIESMLKNDIQVVEVFAQFLRGSHLDFGRHNNRKMFEDVLKYCSTVHHKWRVDFKRRYFENPWTVASLIAAILILLLTFAQTFYTIYAYHHPPST